MFGIRKDIWLPPLVAALGFLLADYLSTLAEPDSSISWLVRIAIIGGSVECGKSIAIAAYNRWIAYATNGSKVLSFSGYLFATIGVMTGGLVLSWALDAMTLAIKHLLDGDGATAFVGAVIAVPAIIGFVAMSKKLQSFAETDAGLQDFVTKFGTQK